MGQVPNELVPAPFAPGEADQTDRSLLRRLQLGQEDAAAKLYRRYSDRLRALVRQRSSRELARRLDPDDLVQSVFCRFFSNARQGDYSMPDTEELWGLLFVIALNKVRAAENFHRAKKRDLSRTPIQIGIQDLTSRDAVADGNDAFFQLAVSEALDRLTEFQRDVIQLRIAGFGVSEIADRTKRSLRTVERALQEAREKLKGLRDEFD